MNEVRAGDERRRCTQLPRAELERRQLERLNALLERTVAENAFYAEKLADAPKRLAKLPDLAALPYTYKTELLSGAPHGDAFSANHSYPPRRYTRWHQTSGTRGRPLVLLDTEEDWRWWIDCWQHVLDAAEASSEDRVLMAFSFGPFVGFWAAYESAAERGCLVIPAGGLNTLGRLELLRASQATVVCCTPSYALHLAEAAEERKWDLPSLPVRRIIVAGEPGGSVPAVRERIETAWGARVVDHAGATEVGPWGVGDIERRGLHVIESEFVAEFLSVETGEPAAEGHPAELVLTNLGRHGCPIIRYRTGDVVKPVWSHDGVCRWVLLEGGVLGRTDDMFVVRGVNVFPSSIEQILRGFPEVSEYRLTVSRRQEMEELSIEVEDRLMSPTRIAEELQLRLGLRIDVTCVAAGSLPRFEGKGQRVRRTTG